MKFFINCFLVVSCVSMLNASPHDSTSHNHVHKDTKSNQKGAQIQGDAIVLEDSSCKSKIDKSLISSLKSKDSKQSVSKEECASEH